MNILTNLKNAIRNLGRRGQHNMVKILCLGVGLSVGFVLIAKVYFELSYESFIPDKDRTYLVNEKVVQNGELKEYPQTSGAVAHGIERYAPQVEAATRFMTVGNETTFQTDDNRKFDVRSVTLADSSFFDLLPLRIDVGKPHDVLSRPGYCFITDKLAKSIGGNVVGMTLTFPQQGGKTLIVGGVYQEIPENSSYHYVDVIASLSTLPSLTHYDGRENWVGNDSYTAIIRLKSGATTADLMPSVAKMIKDNLPTKALKQAGVSMEYSFTQIAKIHTDDPNVKKMVWILALLVIVLLICAVMNYLLIVIGSLVGRAKEMAVHKCYGAGNGNIVSIIFSESFVHLILSIALAAILIFLCKGTITKLLGASVPILLFGKGIWILVAVCLVILFITGLVPGWLYAHIPVSSAFRSYRENRRHWKLILLAVQFAAAGFLLTLLSIIAMQYKFMINDNPGYEYNDLAVVDLSGLKTPQRLSLINEVRNLSSVKAACGSDFLPLGGLSGNNVYLPGDTKELFNISDFYGVGHDYFAVMGIRILQGRNFMPIADSTINEVMVDSSFVQKMKVVAQWDGNVVGRQIIVTEHSKSPTMAFTICGVFNDIRRGPLNNLDSRPSVAFPGKDEDMNYLLIRFHHLTAENRIAVSKVIQSISPDQDVTFSSFKSLMISLYDDSRNFRDAVMVGGLVTLIIALIGLIGYTNDEVSRRHKEIAIRKVNGADVKDILNIFMRDILKIAIPALFVGGFASFLVARKWLEQFSEKITLNPLLFIACGVVILIVILVVVNINCRRISESNPVEYLKGE